MYPLLPFLVVLPFLGSVLTLLLNRKYSHAISVIVSIAVFAVTAIVLALAKSSGYNSLSFSIAYIQQLNLNMSFAVTQLTLILLLMTAIVFLAAAVAGSYFIRERERIYNIIFLIAEGSSLAVFIVGNLLLLYIFWEVTEIMMFFIIFLYGGYNRRYASIKFLIYSLFSSLLLLIGIILLYNSSVPNTFDISTLAANSPAIGASTQMLVFVLLLLSFMIKMPIFPLHTWLPDAHTEAPTTGSMILAGVLLKFGGYGLFLMLYILPMVSQYSSSIALLFIFSSIYGAAVALKQGNIKRMIAYTSITDMAIVGVGLFAANALGTNGAFYSMLSHGIAISLLFLIAGTLDELYGTLEIDKIRGVMKNFPGISYLFILGVFALVGIPLTSGFIADILLFFGAFDAFHILGALPLAGILIIGVTFFWVIERSFTSPVNTTEPYDTLRFSVIASGAFLFAATVVFGILPLLLL